MTRKIFPSFIPGDERDVLWCAIKNLSEIRKRATFIIGNPTKLDYNPYLQFIKFVETAFFTLWHSFVSTSIFSKIPRLSSPINIIERIIFASANAMTGKHPLGTGRNKCFQKKSCNRWRLIFSVFAQNDMFPSTFSNRWIQKFGLVQQPMSSTHFSHRIDIPYFITKIIWETWNWFHNIASTKMLPSSLAYSNALRGLTENPEAYLQIEKSI